MRKEDLKNALLNRDFDKAQSLINEWAALAKAQIRGASGQSERQRIFDEAVSFAQDHIFLTRVVRAHLATELKVNSASLLYHDADSVQHHWQINA
jgi:hypothetical protein